MGAAFSGFLGEAGADLYRRLRDARKVAPADTDVLMIVGQYRDFEVILKVSPSPPDVSSEPFEDGGRLRRYLDRLITENALDFREGEDVPVQGGRSRSAEARIASKIVARPGLRRIRLTWDEGGAEPGWVVEPPHESLPKREPAESGEALLFEDDVALRRIFEEAAEKLVDMGLRLQVETSPKRRIRAKNTRGKRR